MWNSNLTISPVMAIGYTSEDWVCPIYTLKIRKAYFLCFILTFYKNI